MWSELPSAGPAQRFINQYTEQVRNIFQRTRLRTSANIQQPIDSLPEDLRYIHPYPWSGHCAFRECAFCVPEHSDSALLHSVGQLLQQRLLCQPLENFSSVSFSSDFFCCGFCLCFFSESKYISLFVSHAQNIWLFVQVINIISSNSSSSSYNIINNNNI